MTRLVLEINNGKKGSCHFSKKKKICTLCDYVFCCDSVLSLQILMLADQIFSFFRLGYYNPELSTNV